MRPTGLLAIVLYVGCGPLSPPGRDAGTGGGVFGVGGGSGGGATGGGGGATGGGTTDGGPQPFRWMTIGGLAGSSLDEVVGMAGAYGDVWVLTSDGSLQHSNGGGFQLVVKLPSDAQGFSLSASMPVVLYAGNILWCTSNCTTPLAFQSFDLRAVQPGLNGRAICSQGASIAVVADYAGATTHLFEWNGTTFTRTQRDLGVVDPRACWFDSAGRIYVAARDRVAVVEEGSASAEQITSNMTSMLGGADVGGTPWVVGEGGVIQRRFGSTWRPLEPGFGEIVNFRTIAAYGPSDVYVFGAYSLSSTEIGRHWDGTSTIGLGPLIATNPQSTLTLSLITRVDELYVAGHNDSGPLVLRGRR